jgi:cytochrome c biogenesis factor
MIQRIQTLYLAVVVIVCTLLFFFPMIDYINDIKGTYKLFVTGLRYYADVRLTLFFLQTLPLLLLVCSSILLAVIAILLFKKRTMQILLININILVNIILIALVFLVYSKLFEHRLQTVSTYTFGMYIPLISLVFLVLANRAVRKDIALVKSADRLR